VCRVPVLRYPVGLQPASARDVEPLVPLGRPKGRPATKTRSAVLRKLTNGGIKYKSGAAPVCYEQTLSKPRGRYPDKQKSPGRPKQHAKGA
jgi:hypothetical protein